MHVIQSLSAYSFPIPINLNTKFWRSYLIVLLVKQQTVNKTKDGKSRDIAASKTLCFVLPQLC